MDVYGCLWVYGVSKRHLSLEHKRQDNGKISEDISILAALMFLLSRSSMLHQLQWLIVHWTLFFCCSLIYLLETISPIVGWCSIGTFTNPCHSFWNQSLPANLETQMFFFFPTHFRVNSWTFKVWCSHVRLFPGPWGWPRPKACWIWQRTKTAAINLSKFEDRHIDSWKNQVLINLLIKLDVVGLMLAFSRFTALVHTPTPESHPEVGAQAKN